MASSDYTIVLSEVEDYFRNQERTIGAGESKPSHQGEISIPSVFLQSASFHEVYPGIILGDYQIAKDIPKLNRLGITHLVNCAQGTRYNHINTDQEFFSDANIRFHGITAKGTLNFQIAPFLEAAADFIQNALDEQGKIYVHCQRGISRSATVVISYLMIKHSMRLIDALKTVRQKRPVKPNKGFIKQLCELDIKLLNER